MFQFSCRFAFLSAFRLSNLTPKVTRILHLWLKSFNGKHGDKITRHTHTQTHRYIHIFTDTPLVLSVLYTCALDASETYSNGRSSFVSTAISDCKWYVSATHREAAAESELTTVIRPLIIPSLLLRWFYDGRFCSVHSCSARSLWK